MAYSADKGEKLLEVQTNLRGGMGPPIIPGSSTASSTSRWRVEPVRFDSFLPVERLRRPLRRPQPPPLQVAAPAGAGGDGLHVQAEATPPPPPPPGFGGGPSVTPKILTFVLDGKEPLPAAPSELK